MKRLFSILLAVAALTIVGCQIVDLSPLEKRIADLEKTVQRLDEISLTGDYITDIKPLSENGEIVGYVVTFKEHGTFTVRNGKNGQDGVGTPGEAGLPGADGDTWFADVTVTDDTVVFTLADDNNTQFVIPRAGAAADFGLIVEQRDWTVSSGGQKVTVPFTIKGGDDQTVVSVMASEGYKATVDGDKIIIIAPEEPSDAQIWAVAENGAGKSSVVVLRISFEEAQIIAPDKSKWTVSAEGNVITIDLGGESTQSAIVLSQSTDIAEATLPGKFSLAASLNGEEWNDILTDQPLVGRGGSQVFELGKFVNATKLKVTFSDPFEADLPVKLPEVDVMSGETATCELVDVVAAPALKNATQPFAHTDTWSFDTDGSGRFRSLLKWNHSQSTWGISYDLGLDWACVWTCPAWGCSAITNGKVWQTMDFEPGYYYFDAYIHGADYEPDVDMFMVVSAGEGGEDGVNLPDVTPEGVLTPNENTLAYLDVRGIHFVNEGGAEVSTLTSLVFKVTSAGPVSLGWVENTHMNTYQDEAGGWHYIWQCFYFTGFAIR